MEIKEIGGNVSKAFKDNKWLTYGVVLVVIFVLVKKVLQMGSGGTTVVAPSGYTSYPDSVTNANVIIDSINKNTDYNTGEILEAIDGNFTDTNGFIQEGFGNLNERLDGDFNDVLGGIEEIGGKVDIVGGKVDKVQSGINDINKGISNIQKPTTPTTTTPASNKAQYYAKANYGGVSIVDGFKSIGITSLNGRSIMDWRSRSAVAQANGISGYRGTASQNTYLLNLLKAGKLKKA